MTDYKQLCAELIDALDSGIPSARICNSLLADRARAALAEPEPQRRCLYSPVQIAECGGPCEQGPEHCDCGELCVTEPEPEGPTDEDLRQLRRENGWPLPELLIFSIARAVLARWGK